MGGLGGGNGLIFVMDLCDVGVYARDCDVGVYAHDLCCMKGYLRQYSKYTEHYARLYMPIVV